MRTDRRLSALSTITPEQRYFLACWYNMVHEYSLDSFRVRVMNPLTVVREMQLALGFTEAKPEDKAMILEEAHQLLVADRVLPTGLFQEINSRLLALLQGDKVKLVTAKGPTERLLGYVLSELRPLLEEHYVGAVFAELKALLTRPVGGPAPSVKDIHSLTASLLSTLLDRDFSLESLYHIYTEVLVPRKKGSPYRFDRKLGLAEVLLNQPKKVFDVTFALDQVTQPDDLPPALGNLSISASPPFSLHSNHPKTSYLNPLSKRLFVTVTGVEATDRRAAGLHAYEQVANVINLLRFEYEQARLHIPDQFAVLDREPPKPGGRVYQIPRVVPNPMLSLNGKDAADFVTSVNELVAGPHFSDEGRDRIASAFRLYRQGRDQQTIETKLVHWWTAMEYLVRGSQAGGGIGKGVETSIAPVIGLSYVPKLLVAVRHLLSDTGVVLHDSAGPIDLKALTLVQLWDLFRDPAQQSAINSSLASEPFLQVQVAQFFDELTGPAILLERLKRHEQRVRWQVQRLWRTRCNIVHSAGRGSNQMLLCSNLEYYLKTALHGLLNALRSVPTLSGPHEYFDREAYRYECIATSLGAGQVTALRNSLLP